MRAAEFRGLGVAMVTPFLESGAIDFPALEKLTEFLIKDGVDYLVVQGTTGESPVLSKTEKQEVLDCVAKKNAGRLPIVFGIGGNNTAAVVNDLKTYDLSQVQGILSASPYYNKPTQEGIYQHYKAIAEASPLPVIVYNVPGRTSSNITADTCCRLAKDFENLVAVKEASGSMEQIMRIINEKPEGFMVISGDDAITLPILACGGDGVISVVGNALPAQFSKMVNAGLEDRMDEARELHYGILPIIAPLFAEGNPGGIKEALVERGIMGNTVRLPLVSISTDLKNEIQSLCRNICERFPYQN